MTIQPHSAEAVGRGRILRALSAMPYSGSMDYRPPDFPQAMEMDEGVFDAAIAAWLEELVQVLTVAGRTTYDMSQELDKLRRQREAVRSFLGTDKLGTA